MNLNNINDLIFSSKELDYLENEEEMLERKLKLCKIFKENAIKTRGVLYRIIRNSPETNSNLWHRENGSWVSSSGWNIQILKHSDSIDFYINLFNDMGIKYKLEKDKSQDRNYDIYNFSYKITIEEYDEIVKFLKSIEKEKKDYNVINDTIDKIAKKTENGDTWNNCVKQLKKKPNRK